MRSVSQDYKDIRESGLYHYEVKVINGTNEYGMDVLKSLTVHSTLFSESYPSIGGTASAEADLELFEESANWGRGSRFDVFFQIISDVTEDTASEWIQYGSYYTDTREESNGVLRIVGYDAMLMTEVTWWDKISNDIVPTEFPISAYEAATLALSATEISLEDAGTLDQNVKFIGLNTAATVRETLADIAAGMGANWCINSNGELRLMPFKRENDLSESAIVGFAVAGRSVVGTNGQSSDVSVIRLGRALKTLDVGTELGAIVGAELVADDGTVAKTSNASGYWMKGNCNFSNTDVAGLCLNNLSGYRYKSYKANGAWLDPVAELGDIIIVDGSDYVIYDMETTFGTLFNMYVSAPLEEEIDHEYQVLDSNKKSLRKALQAVKASETNVRTELNSSIQQTASQIRTEVSESYFTKEEGESLESSVSTRIMQTANSLQVSITSVQSESRDNYREVSSYIRYSDGKVVVGESNNQSDLRISANEVGMYYNGQRTTYWNQNEQVTPNKLRVPLGGSLQIGNFLFTPRSSGNLSLLYVGGESNV